MSYFKIKFIEGNNCCVSQLFDSGTNCWSKQLEKEGLTLVHCSEASVRSLLASYFLGSDEAERDGEGCGEQDF